MYESLLFIIYICIFLAGMAALRNGLFNLSGESLKKVLSKVTDAPWKGFLTGTIITGVLQSSSAVMVMTVGLVSVGSLSFSQTIGIILGSNIGSTVTTEFMTLSLDKWAIPGIIAGVGFCLIPHIMAKSFGTALIGLSAIFAAIGGFKMLAGPLSSLPLVDKLLISIENHLVLALITGIVVTAIIHSSSATIGIAMSFLAGAQISVYAGIAIMLGSNIGTCITGYMASIGSGPEAKFTAYAHIWLNVLGVLFFLPFIGSMESLTALLTTDKALQLAHASVLFNVITSVLVLPFSRQFAKMILFLHKG
ncbi:Na/Pi symporter [Peribacillus sp. SCS-155]|uniref:Na/Pi symporter n=1 Tax=Peribacillus sedimenti TaxID=3115297 RepID=UPI0039057914